MSLVILVIIPFMIVRFPVDKDSFMESKVVKGGNFESVKLRFEVRVILRLSSSTFRITARSFLPGLNFDKSDSETSDTKFLGM